MAEFGLTETQEMFRRQVAIFARRELAPGAKQRAKMNTIPQELITKLSKMELLGLTAPSEYGGQPADAVTVGIVMEEIAKADWVAASVVFGNIVAFAQLEHSGEKLRQEWIPPLVKGEKVSCGAVTEPDCGSDLSAIKAKAVRDGDYYVLSGEKTSVTRGIEADAAIMYLRTSASAGTKGISCFLVPLDLPGITRSRFEDMGWKPMGRASLILDEVRLPSEYLIGEEGMGAYTVLRSFDFARVYLALIALGIAQVSLDETIEYAKQRTAFSRPIAKFEGISFKIAEAATMIEGARLLAYRALWLRDQGIRHTKEAAMCKFWCPQLAAHVVHDCLLIFGHVGYTEECPIEQRLRDVIGFEIADGTADIQKLIIARELMGREFLPY